MRSRPCFVEVFTAMSEQGVDGTESGVKGIPPSQQVEEMVELGVFTWREDEQGKRLDTTQEFRDFFTEEYGHPLSDAAPQEVADAVLRVVDEEEVL